MIRRTLQLVSILNLLYFIVEFGMGLAIGSVSLFADSIDFLEGASMNLLVLVALDLERAEAGPHGNGAVGRSVSPWNSHVLDGLAQIHRTSTSFVVAALVDGSRRPRRESSCALLLARYRGHSGSLTRAAFLSARNDVLANVAIIAAGLPITSAS